MQFDDLVEVEEFDVKRTEHTDNYENIVVVETLAAAAVAGRQSSEDPGVAVGNLEAVAAAGSIESNFVAAGIVVVEASIEAEAGTADETQEEMKIVVVEIVVAAETVVAALETFVSIPHSIYQLRLVSAVVSFLLAHLPIASLTGQDHYLSTDDEIDPY